MMTADQQLSPQTAPDTAPLIRWQQDEQAFQAQWRSERQAAPPQRVLVVDDTLSADKAMRLARNGTALLWAGDFQNARHLIQALSRRLDRPGRAKPARPDTATQPESAAQGFHRHRMAMAQRAQILAQVLIPLEPDRSINLRRAPDLRQACWEAWGAPTADASVVALTELLGVVSAHEWRKRGVEVAALGPPPRNRIHPHYGVFSPVRGEYVDLVQRCALPAGADKLALDIGTGSGVLAAVLALRGIKKVLATDQDTRALVCAKGNLARLGLTAQVELVRADLFPPAPGLRASLVVCNPPWLPAKASSSIERAVYDEGSSMLRGFLSGLSTVLAPGGEGWLILSDLAEHLGLRSRQDMLGWIAEAGLVVKGRLDTRPQHRKVADTEDALHRARAAETTSLWRLGLPAG